MSEPLRYNATKVVGEYGEQARLQHRLHLSPDPNGKWVKYEDYKRLRDLINRIGCPVDNSKLEYATNRQQTKDWLAGKTFIKQENERA